MELERDTIGTYPGGTAYFVLSVSGASGSPVTVHAETTPATTVETVPSQRSGGGVFEVLIRPDASLLDQQLSVTITASQLGAEASRSATVNVWEWDDSDHDIADALKQDFLAFLEANHAAFGVGPDTVFQGFHNDPHTAVINHRIYISSDYEFTVSWHVTIEPHNWAKAYLRKRNEMLPMWGGEMPSWTADRTVHDGATPTVLIR